MNFRSVAQLSDQVLAWSKRLPPDLDVIVGIPRSGLLVATLLATYRNLPLTDVDGLLEGRCFRTGHVKPNSVNGRGAPDDAHLRVLEQPRRVLVVDDTISTGESFHRVKKRIEAAGLPHRISYGAVYALPDKTDAVDYYQEILHAPRIFEWNLLHHQFILPNACVDMDGVLCHDPPEGDDDDGERYLRFLTGARPLVRPTAEIGWIVTSRLEKYRPQTEAWLAEHGVKYRNLVMLDYPDAASRRSMRIYSANKAHIYRETGAQLFIESNIRQAVEIAALARKDVLCIDTMQLITPGALPVGRPVAHFGDRSEPSPVRKMARRLLSSKARARLLKMIR